MNKCPFEQRARELQRRIKDEGIDAAILTDPDSIFYYTGAHSYAGIEIGRPTLAVLPREGDCSLITPLMESEMVGRLAWMSDVRPWEDGVGEEWMGPLRKLIGGMGTLGFERLKVPALVGEPLREEFPTAKRKDIMPLIAEMRRIKSPEEIAVMRRAGEVAIAMTKGAESVIAEGVPEYEVALAIIAAGTRKAGEFMDADGVETYFSPTIHNLQILQSGHDTSMVHRRSTNRRLQRGDPIYCCYCGIADYQLYKLGFDRQYFVGEVSDEIAKSYETTIAAQQAALDAVHPGVPCEDIHFAAQEVYRSAGYSAGYRTGRSIGCSYIEKPELKAGDKTPLAPGMTICIDGGISVAGRYGTRVGDSLVVTASGFEYFTPYPKSLRVL